MTAEGSLAILLFQALYVIVGIVYWFAVQMLLMIAIVVVYNFILVILWKSEPLPSSPKPGYLPALFMSSQALGLLLLLLFVIYEGDKARDMDAAVYVGMAFMSAFPTTLASADWYYYPSTTLQSMDAVMNQAFMVCMLLTLVLGCLFLAFCNSAHGFVLVLLCTIMAGVLPQVWMKRKKNS